MKRFTSETQKMGKIGEEIACMFLVKHGLSILDQNMTRKWGEIDIIAKKEGKLHFIEVKLLKNKGSLDVSRLRQEGYTGQAPNTGLINPFENITFHKLERIQRTVLVWLSENRVSHETSFQIDGIAVRYNTETKEAHVKMLQNINIV